MSGNWLSGLEKPETFVPIWSEASKKLANLCLEYQRSSRLVGHRCVKTVGAERGWNSVLGAETPSPLCPAEDRWVTAQRGLALGTLGPADGGGKGASWKWGLRDVHYIYLSICLSVRLSVCLSVCIHIISILLVLFLWGTLNKTDYCSIAITPEYLTEGEVRDVVVKNSVIEKMAWACMVLDMSVYTEVCLLIFFHY